MLVKDIMTTNVVTIPSSTPILEARKIMEAHNVRRIPVVDKGILVGMITKAITRRVAPTEATSLSVWEINYLMAKMVVKDVMKTDVVTVSPDITVECAVATAQQSGVGALPVLEDGVLVGVLTTNDFFYKILNPLLGINEDGTRLVIYGADTPDQMCKVLEIVKNQNMSVKAVHTIGLPNSASRDLIIHLDTNNAADLTAQLKSAGFHLDEREFQACSL